MNIEPLSKAIYEKAKKLGTETIVLKFCGGNDEGHLYVETTPYNAELESAVEDWAWTVYEYNGAGDGTDYGDTITYDLVKGKASTEEWYHVVQSQMGATKKLQLANDDE